MKLEINSAVETLENAVLKIMNRKEFQAFGESKGWNLSEFKAYNDGYNDEGWAKHNNTYEENTLAWWLYNAGNYDSNTNN